MDRVSDMPVDVEARYREEEVPEVRELRFVESCGVCEWASEPLPIAWARRARVAHHREHHADPAGEEGS